MFDALFPWDEFKALIEKVLEVLSNPEADEGIKATGLDVLRDVYSRIQRCDDTSLKARVDQALNLNQSTPSSQPTSPKPAVSRPLNLRGLVEYISQSTDAGSVYVLKRTDRLGSQAEQESAIRSHFETLSNLWFAPPRIGQKTPAMAFIGFSAASVDLTDGPIEVGGSTLAISRFNYDHE